MKSTKNHPVPPSGGIAIDPNPPLSCSEISPVLSRREALRLLAGAGLYSALRPIQAAAEGQGGPLPGGKRLGLCSICYMLRWPAVDRGRASWDEMLEFLKYSHQLGAGGIQTSILPTEGFSAKMRAQVEESQMYLEGQAPLPHSDGEVEQFEARVRAAKDAGATVIRTACLGGRRYEVFKDAETFSDFARQSEQSILRAEPIVRKHGIRLAIENHKDWRVPELLALLKRVDSEYIGVCVDTGNSIALLEDPMAVVEAYAPYAFATHLKDMAVQEYEQGFLLAEVPLGEGFLDLPQIVSTLRRARPEIQFSLEMITRDPLQIPCLTRPYWATLESLPGWVLAGALSMVRGHAARGSLLRTSGMAPQEKLEAEDRAVRRSLAYAREHLAL